jgi:hypothetical protein
VAVGGGDARDAAAVVTARTDSGHAAPEIDALLAVEVGEPRPHFVAEQPGERGIHGLEHRDLDAERARRCGHFLADEPRADDDQPPSGPQRCSQPAPSAAVRRRYAFGAPSKSESGRGSAPVAISSRS